MLEKLIQQHEKDLENLLKNLVDAVQPYVNDFCNKYDISFGTGWGAFWFHFGFIQGRPDEGFLKQLDEELFEVLNYKFDGRHELGSVLQDYTIKLEPHQLVYIHCDNTIEECWISEKPTQLNIAEFGLMSRKIAEKIVNNSNIDLREW